MLKVTLVILLTVMASTFAMDNMHHVDLGLVVGSPVSVRLFFLLLTSFLVGCLLATLMNFYIGAKSEKPAEVEQKTEEEDFFSE
ncbi:MAG: hypothetical protein ACYSU0_03955 [Planctomycetota bacterium]